MFWIPGFPSTYSRFSDVGAYVPRRSLGGLSTVSSEQGALAFAGLGSTWTALYPEFSL